MYRRVLVPLDGSRLAEGILPFVLQIAGPLDLEVALVRVVEPIMTQTLEGTGHAEIMKTGVPTSTWLKSHSACGTSIRMQPCESE